MAAPTVQTLHDGVRNLVVNIVGLQDTTGATIVDVSSLSADPQGRACTEVALELADYDTDAPISLQWDADSDVTFATYSTGSDSKCYRRMGSISNNSGSGKSGDVLIPAPAVAATYTLTLWFVKKYD
jgi:hypothetical protein